MKTIKIEEAIWSWIIFVGISATTLAQIITANSTTLEYIDWTIQIFDPNLLRPCTQLKFLRLMSSLYHDGVPRSVNNAYHFPRLIHVDLQILCLGASPFLVGYGALLTSCGPTIRHLSVQLLDKGDRNGELDTNGWTWLNSCINLEYLKLDLFNCDLTTNAGAQFLRLKEFDFKDTISWNINTPKNIALTNWINGSMPNLKVVKLGRHVGY